MLHKSQGEVFFDKSRFKVLACGRRWGKALDVDTPLFTTEGWKTMGTIAPGDKVFSPTGKPVRVRAVSEVYENRPCYEIQFFDGESIVADANHQWQVWNKPKRDGIRRGNRGITWAGEFAGSILHTDELYDKFLQQDIQSYWAIHATAPLQTDPQKLPIDPYVFGAWVVSDPSRKGNMVKLKFPETVSEFGARGYDLRYKGVKYDWYCRRLKKEIANLGWESIEEIPEVYQKSSLSDRVALLQGIIEGGGFYQRNGKLQIKCKSAGLCRDIVSLFYSLGQKVEIKAEPYQRGGKTQDFFRLIFRPCQGLVATRYRRINKKLAEASQFNDKWRFIRRVRQVESRPVRCIEVANSTGMFCAGRSFVPTHNSRLLLSKAASAAINYKGDYDPLSPPHVLIAMPELKQARSIHWQSILNFFENHPAVHSINKSDLRIKFKGQKPDLILRGTNENNGDSLRGLKLYFAGIDEFQDVKKIVWENVISPALADTKDSKALLTGTPKGKTSFFYYLFANAPQWPNWNSFTYFTSDNPFLDRDEIENARKMLPARIFRQEFEASFEDFAGKIYTELTQDHLVPDEQLPAMHQYALGIDWGDLNPAIVVVGIYNNPEDGLDYYYVVDYWKNPNQNPKEAVTHEFHNQEIIKRYKKFNADLAYADPSQPGRIISLRKAGVKHIRSGYNRVEEGNGVVNILLAQRRLLFSQSCEQVFLEAEAYHRAEKDGVLQEEVAKDQEDHTIDSLRYLCATREHKNINRLLNPSPVSAQVETRKGLYENDRFPWEGYQ